MKGKDFLNSKWMKKAASVEGQQKVKENFNKWAGNVKNTGLIGRAKQLYQFFLSPEITGTQKILVSAALLYIISPLDIISDFLPVIGWLDDIGVASFALSYIFAQMDKLEQIESAKQTDIDELLENDIAGTSIKHFKTFNSDRDSAILLNENENKSEFFKDKN